MQLERHSWPVEGELSPSPTFRAPHPFFFLDARKNKKKKTQTKHIGPFNDRLRNVSSSLPLFMGWLP